jgi:flagellar biosynthesis anti-sigma factor FlgM
VEDAMKVNATSELLSVDRGTAGPGTAVKNVTPAAAREGTGGDAVALSDLASRLIDLRREMGARAEVDTRRVREVRDQIDRGVYVPDPDAIAEKLIASARELLPRKG